MIKTLFLNAYSYQDGVFLKTETRDKLSDPKLLEMREPHFSRLEALYARKSLDYAFALNGIAGYASV